MKPSLTLLLLASACAAPPAPVPPKPAPPPPAPIASAQPADPLAEPPPPGITPSAPFPAVEHRQLPNGLAVAVVPRSSFPVVEIRLVVRSGQATDGELPGLSSLTGRLLKDGGAGRFTSQELAERTEALGSRLSIDTDRDSTRIALGVTKGDLDRALEIVQAVVEKPRFPGAELEKLRQREIDRVKDRARTSPSWLAATALYRELYALPVSVHPYASYDASPKELAAIRLRDVKAWYRKHVTPENAELVVAGDVTADDVERAATTWLGGWRGSRPEPVSFPDPHGPNSRVLLLVDRPGSTQSQILVAAFGPERASEDYAALRASNQVLGGGVAGRLFLDVREKRSLAYSTGSWVEEPAHGPMPLVLSAGTQTAKTAEAVSALLEHFARLGQTAPTVEELDRAARFLSDSFLFRMETAGAIAELTSGLFVLGLPDESYDEYRHAVRELSPEDSARVAARYYKPGSEVIVVVGDAGAVKHSLARIGAVSVLDPENDFSIREALPKE